MSQKEAPWFARRETSRVSSQEIHRGCSVRKGNGVGQSERDVVIPRSEKQNGFSVRKIIVPELLVPGLSAPPFPPPNKGGQRHQPITSCYQQIPARYQLHRVRHRAPHGLRVGGHQQPLPVITSCAGQAMDAIIVTTLRVLLSVPECYYCWSVIVVTMLLLPESVAR